MCFSSPLEKFNSSSEFLSSTVPLVSVCAMSMPHVKTPTFALLALFTVPIVIVSPVVEGGGTHPRENDRKPFP